MRKIEKFVWVKLCVGGGGRNTLDKVVRAIKKHPLHYLCGLSINFYKHYTCSLLSNYF
jgi:hypothetical protein